MECQFKYNDSNQLIKMTSPRTKLAHFGRQIMTFADKPYDFSFATDEEYIYNDDGSLKQIEGYYLDQKAFIITYKYENGIIVGEHAITNTDECNTIYSYNWDGTIANIMLDKNSSPSVYFYYNTDGLLRQCKIDVAGHNYNIDYYYREDGVLDYKDVTYFNQPYMKEIYNYNEDGTIDTITYDYYEKTNGTVVISHRYKTVYTWDGTDTDAEITSNN